jgi:DNA repair photolyase
MHRRGTSLDTGNRFISTSSERFDDGWESLAEDEVRQTELIDDNARTAFATNSSPDIPFTHSINPYRGCEHGCAYCMAGDTLILMADGTTRELKELKIGDRIYGTERRGTYRHYVTTTVLNHWATRKPAYRITLNDGTMLVASGDHRFLTERGWKYVGAERAMESDEEGTLSADDCLIGSEAGSVAEGSAIKSNADLRIASIEPLDGIHDLFDITTGTGDFIANGVVSHNCYARPTHEYLGYNAGLDFETKIIVKRNAAALARAEMMKKSWKPTTVSISGVTDPYQPVERELKITRRILETMLEFRNPVGIVTKNAGVLRDLDILAEMAKLDLATVFMSITTLDRDLARRLEPRTSTPERRLEAVRRLTDAGIPVGVMMAPLIPGLTDEEIPSLLKAAADAGAREAYHVILRLPLAVRPIFLDWLEREEPGRAAKVRHALEEMRGGVVNLAEFGKRMGGTGARADMISDLFGITARRLGLGSNPIRLTTEHFRRPAPGGQMGLW